MSGAWTAGVQSYGPSQVIGRCTCGWQGRPRQLTATAQRDVEHHMLNDEHQE